MLYLYVHNKCWDHLTLLLLSFYSDEFEKSLYLVLLSFTLSFSDIFFQYTTNNAKLSAHLQETS